MSICVCASDADKPFGAKKKRKKKEAYLGNI